MQRAQLRGPDSNPAEVRRIVNQEVRQYLMQMLPGDIKKEIQNFEASQYGEFLEKKNISASGNSDDYEVYRDNVLSKINAVSESQNKNIKEKIAAVIKKFVPINEKDVLIYLKNIYEHGKLAANIRSPDLVHGLKEHYFENSKLIWEGPAGKSTAFKNLVADELLKILPPRTQEKYSKGIQKLQDALDKNNITKEVFEHCLILFIGELSVPDRIKDSHLFERAEKTGQPFREELEYALRSIENGLSETEVSQLENLQCLWGVDNQRADMRAKFREFDKRREVSRLIGAIGTGPVSAGFSHAFFYIQARTQYLERLPDTTRAEFVKTESALRELCTEGILSYEGYCSAIHRFISDKINAIKQKFPAIKV